MRHSFGPNCVLIIRYMDIVTDEKAETLSEEMPLKFIAVDAFQSILILSQRKTIIDSHCMKWFHFGLKDQTGNDKSLLSYFLAISYSWYRNCGNNKRILFYYNRIIFIFKNRNGYYLWMVSIILCKLNNEQI